MSTLYSISSDTLTGLADAVRQLNGTSAPLSPDDMIDGIEGHVCPSPTIQSLSVTQNGEYVAPSGVDGYSPVTVNVSGGGGGGLNVGTKTVTLGTIKSTYTFDNLDGTPKAAFLRATSNLSRTTGQVTYYVADIFWDGTAVRGNFHYRAGGILYPTSASENYAVSVNGNSITFTGTTNTSRPGAFDAISYELVYFY